MPSVVFPKMNKAGMLTSRGFSSLHPIAKHSIKLKQHLRFPQCLSPLACNSRFMGSHGPPAKWKSPKEIAIETKSHMDFLPVPQGSWQESYDKQQRKWNMLLLGSAAALGITVIIIYKSGSIYLHDFDYRTFKANGSSALLAGSPPSTEAAASMMKPPAPAKEEGAAAASPEARDIPEHAQYLLIGAGTAAFGAFRAIKSRDPKAKILIIGEENSVPYMRPPLSKELWFNDDKAEVDNLQFRQWNGKKRSVFYEPKEFFADPKKLDSLENGGIALVKGRKVVKLDAGNKSVWLSSGDKITYDKCLIATGGRPRTLPVLANASPEVRERTVLFRNLEDFKRLNSITDSAESVAIVGGGFLGSELACALGKKGKKNGFKVFQIFPEKGNMGHVLPEYLSKWTTAKVQSEGVDVLPEQTVTNAVFENGKVLLTTDGGKLVEVDCVVSAVGLEPNVDLARSSNLELDPVNGGFVVNAELEARRDLWVAGDAACFYDVKLGRRRVEHHDHAVVSGRLAGENMTGASKPYWHQSMFWSDLGPDVGYEAIGIVDSSLKTVAVFAKSTEADTPKAAVEASGDSLRSEVKEVSNIVKGNNMVKKSALDEEDYGKGVVFYLNNKKTVVGILLWNTFNKMSIARQVLRDGARNEDLYEVAKLFDLYDTAVEAEEETAS